MVDEQQYLMAVVRDISARKQAEDASREGEARFRSLFESSPVPIWEEDFSGVVSLLKALTDQGVDDIAAYLRQYPELVQQCAGSIRVTDVNRAAVLMHQASTKDELLQGFVQTFTPESFVAFQALLMDFYNGKREMEVDTVLQTLSGERRQVTVYNSIISGPKEGQFRALVSTVDITARKQAEGALRDSESKFRALAEHSLDTIMRFDRLHRHLYVNPIVESLTGIAADLFLGKTHRELGFPEELCFLWEEVIENIFKANTTQRLEFLLPTGVWMDWLLAPEVDAQGSVVAVLASGRDITERKQAEQVAEVHLRVLELSTEHSPEQLLQKALDEVETLTRSRVGFVHYVESDQRRLSLQVWSTSTITEFCMGQGKGQHYDVDQAGVWGDCVRQRRPVIHNDYEGLPHKKELPEGHPPIIRQLVVPILRDDEVVAVLGVGNKATDYTESDVRVTAQLADVIWEIARRKQAQQELSRSEARQSKMVENIGDVIVIIDDQGINRYKSPNIENWFGWKPGDVVGHSTWENVHPDDQPGGQQFFDALMAGPAARGTTELRYRCKNGQYKWVEFTGVNLLHDPDIQGILGNYRDISERRRAEEENARLGAELMQSQKMESIGRLAGGVAHDFNNMLGVILGNADLALAQLDPSSPIHGDLMEIRSAAQRSAALTRQLLAFARKQTIAPRVLDLNETVGGMLRMLQRLIGEDIDLTCQLEADLWPVNIDPSQIDQILANLCVNARDAIVGGGKIVIELTNHSLDVEHCVSPPGHLPGDYVRLGVSDNGCGLDSETLAHIFEPFFTTKGPGQGTGLGLATVYGIVKQNMGLIDVHSEPARGTTFAIYLPRHVGKTEQAPTGGGAGPTPGGHETILLVEDESAILKLTARILKRSGYTVLVAETPSQALRVARDHAGEIHLLLTDVVMPEMNGRDLATNLRSHFPSLKFLFMSGYTADIIAPHGVLEGGVHFIQKPFAVNSLSAAVRQALGE